MTAKQKKAQAVFKQVVKEASSLRRSNPSLTQAQAVKKAWAMHSGGSRVAEIGKVASKKKSAKKKVARKNTALLEVRKKVKRVLKANNATMPHGYDIRKGSVRNLSGYDLSVRPSGMYGTPKEFHKDTKSHNVNIRVVSGIGEMNQDTLDHANYLLNRIAKAEEFRDRLISDLKYLNYKMTASDKRNRRSIIKQYNEYIRDMKKTLKQITRRIK